MTTVSVPLDVGSAFTSWQGDPSTIVVIVLLAGGYLFATQRAGKAGAYIEPVRRLSFLAAIAFWFVAACSFVGVFSDTLFWVRALQVVLLLFVVPFGLAMGKPLTVLRAALGQVGRGQFDAVLASRWARVLTYPATSSVVMLATPWLLYMTPWYQRVLDDSFIDAITRLILVVVGFGYFYTRLQADPVPRRYPQLLSLAITVVEVIGDGTLGVVIWLGPQIAAAHYLGLERTWGPSPSLDQTIGAGVLWILGDVVGLPFLFALMRALTRDEKAKADAFDADLDRESASANTTVWWAETAVEADDEVPARPRSSPMETVAYGLVAASILALVVTFAIALLLRSWPPAWIVVGDLGVLLLAMVVMVAIPNRRPSADSAP